MATIRDIVERTFSAVVAKDTDAVVRLFADDAVLIDPHYPTPRMVGKAAIAEGMRWAFTSMKTFGFTMVNFFPSEDGQSAAVEMETHHVLKGGMKLDFPQAFVIELRDGLVIRLQAYEPYGPGGIGGFILKLTRLKRKLSRKGA